MIKTGSKTRKITSVSVNCGRKIISPKTLTTASTPPLSTDAAYA